VKGTPVILIHSTTIIIERYGPPEETPAEYCYGYPRPGFSQISTTLGTFYTIFQLIDVCYLYPSPKLLSTA